MPGVYAAGQVPEDGHEVVREFPYGAVRLTGGRIKQQFDHIHAHYLALDNDRLLKVFREHAGLPAQGPDMGGWYDTDGFVPGLTLDQYISGLTRFGAESGCMAMWQVFVPIMSHVVSNDSSLNRIQAKV